MSHESHQSTENKPKTALSASFWFVLILAGLFIAAVNFVNVMSHDDGGHGTEHVAPGNHGSDAAGHDGHGGHEGHGGESHGDEGHGDSHGH
jgi:hypothetical protein